MDRDTAALRNELRSAGLSDQVIDAAWPSWWSDDAAASTSARAELRFALSRKLGLSSRSLLGERVEFVWEDDARFKNLTATDRLRRGALASFGVAVGRMLLKATTEAQPRVALSAAELRSAVLANREVVDLNGLLSICWGLGVPVIHLRVFPLRAKSMRAMVVGVDGRHAILLGRDASYPAPVAFTLAHEIGHAVLGHIGTGRAIVDVGDSSFNDPDLEEREADTFGIELLTGSPRPMITTNIENFSTRALAEACQQAGPERGIEPGTLALCLGFQRQEWQRASAALRYIYKTAHPVWKYVNQVAARQLNWSDMSDENIQYLSNLMDMGSPDA